ncbi:MAG: serine/threonine protein kinase [Clostridia bacterium]|nr:serine/threonine protein kinase [Clostridia bacterium]
MEFQIDNIKYNLKEFQDLSWISQFGKVFSCIDQTGSGCINFGVEKNNKKYFLKIAGAKTLFSEVSTNTSKEILQNAVKIYKSINHPNLIKLVDCFFKSEFFVAIFEWVDGECLFDHWNFDFYKKNQTILSPIQKFKKLSLNKRLNLVNKLFSFFIAVRNAGFVAVDFYDSSIIYNFDNDEVFFCDIDLFKKPPIINNQGSNYYGTKRLKAPEENLFGASIDEQTNLFTLGGIIFDLFSKTDKSNISERYSKGHFIPPLENKFCLDKSAYNILLKATQLDKSNRYLTFEEFFNEWNTCICNIKN